MFIIGAFISSFNNLLNAPKILFLYILPSFIANRLFLHSIGMERTNIYLIKQLYSSVSDFLIKRAKLNVLASSFLIIPIWFICFLLFPDIISIKTIGRIPLLFINLIISVFFLTVYSAFFAIFKEEETTNKNKSFGVKPVSIFLYYIFSLPIPIFFYLSDIFLHINLYPLQILKFMGYSFLISIILFFAFWHFGIKKLENL